MIFEKKISFLIFLLFFEYLGDGKVPDLVSETNAFKKGDLAVPIVISRVDSTTSTNSAPTVTNNNISISPPDAKQPNKVAPKATADNVSAAPIVNNVATPGMASFFFSFFFFLFFFFLKKNVFSNHL